MAVAMTHSVSPSESVSRESSLLPSNRRRLEWLSCGILRVAETRELTTVLNTRLLWLTFEPYTKTHWSSLWVQRSWITVATRLSTCGCTTSADGERQRETFRPTDAWTCLAENTDQVNTDWGTFYCATEWYDVINGQVYTNCQTVYLIWGKILSPVEYVHAGSPFCIGPLGRREEWSRSILVRYTNRHQDTPYWRLLHGRSASQLAMYRTILLYSTRSVRNTPIIHSAHKPHP